MTTVDPGSVRWSSDCPTELITSASTVTLPASICQFHSALANSAKAAGTPSAQRYPVSELSTALRRACAIGSASVKSISATQAGKTSGGYVRHFALERRLNSARDTSSMAMRQACRRLSRSNDPLLSTPRGHP